MDLGFPWWVRLAHLFNILFITLLMRSGIEILAAHPKLYLNDDSRPGSEWIRFTPKKMPGDQLWTSRDEEESYSSWVALPGGKRLGLGRQWHFFGALGWLLTGLFYVIVMAFSAEWRRLVPISWDIFPQACQSALMYLQLKLPPAGNPFNPLQQLAYFSLIFFLAPLQILTALAMSPAIEARFPWYPSLFGGRQIARSIHFLGLVAFISFTVHHVALVFAHGLGEELAAITLGIEHGATPEQQRLAIGVMGVWLAFVVLVHVWATRRSIGAPRSTQHLLERIVDPAKGALLRPLRSRQRYPRWLQTRSPRVNGRPPTDPAYLALAQRRFAGWTLEVCGLVEQPLRLTLTDLFAMERQTQVTKHNCIQGWSYVAEWTGVPLRAILERCRPLPSARYVVFHAMDEKTESEPDPAGSGHFYGTLDLDLARYPQALLAYEMGADLLSVEHGGPLRLRIENQLGFKMVKWIRAIELVEGYRDVGQGQGGWREDWQHYSTDASI